MGYDYTKLSNRMAMLFDGFRGRAPSAALEAAREFLDYNEYGVAYEALADVLASNRVSITEAELSAMREVAEQMELEAGAWQQLSPLVAQME